MSRISSPGLLSSRERLALAFLAAISIGLGAVYLSQRAFRRTVNLTELYERVIFSNSFFIRPDVDPSRVFDGDPRTAWWDDLNIDPARPRAHISGKSPGPVPAAGLFYIQMELGMTHFPDRPPRINPLLALRIMPGNQADAASFRAYARPRRVHLHIFYQAVVDFDREYRFPGAPVAIASKTVDLADSMGEQIIPVDFLPPVPASPGFPRDIALVWLRMEIESFYPGDRFVNRVAVSELDFDEKFPTHPDQAHRRGRGANR